jgi:hypothetical protein
MMTGSLEARFQTRTVARMQEFSRIKEVVSQHNRHSSGARPRESGNPRRKSLRACSRVSPRLSARRGVGPV